MWKGEFSRAGRFAESMLARGTGAQVSLWREHLGDAAFLTADIQRARGLYEASLAGHPRPGSVWLKLSDVHHKLGDVEKERAFRERVYGTLRQR